MIASGAEETRLQLGFLTTPPGLAGSGAMRYAAAMYFYQHDRLSNKALEIYRALAKDDHGRPREVLLMTGLSRDVELLDGMELD